VAKRLRVYIDESNASKALEKQLQERGIEYTAIRETSHTRPLPALETERQVMSGLGTIRLYFLNGGD
jgi:hypothetical protein